MIVPVAVTVVVLAVVAAHRTFEGLAAISLSWWWLLAVALGLQILVIEVLPGLPDGAAGGLHLLSYAAGLAFVLVNRRHRGLIVLGVGGALNLVAITANDGVMPASESAVQAAGLEHETGFDNSAPIDDPDLLFLGDVFAVPDPWPLANVFSVGDVVVVAGAGLLVHESSRAVRRQADPA